MSLQNKKILVTGGRGFIGGHLVEKLKSLGSEVDIFDSKNGEDITNEINLKNFVKRGYDLIFHLAGLSGPAKSNQNKIDFFKVNTFATQSLCDLLYQFSPKTKLILSSSRLEYGKPIYLPVDEMHPTNPTSIYGLSKLNATQIALLYHKKSDLNVVIFRTSNTYGPNKAKKFEGYNVINHFINQAKKGKSITIFGRGDQLRDYVYIDDLVGAFISAATKNVNGEIFNIGSGLDIKLREMAEIIVKIVGGCKLEFADWPTSYEIIETGSYISNINKAKEMLHFYPRIGFMEGIKKTINS